MDFFEEVVAGGATFFVLNGLLVGFVFGTIPFTLDVFKVVFTWEGFDSLGFPLDLEDEAFDFDTGAPFPTVLVGAAGDLLFVLLVVTAFLGGNFFFFEAIKRNSRVQEGQIPSMAGQIVALRRNELFGRRDKLKRNNQVNPLVGISSMLGEYPVF